jgi:hypothetical protein
MTRRLSFALLALLVSFAVFAETYPRIDRVEPFRLKVQPSGMVRLEFLGEYPYLTGGHPDMDQYEHWFIRRAGGEWQMCTRLSDSCRTSGWRHGMMSLELNAAHWLNTPGTLEFRMNEGLSADGHSPWPFSNIVSVPVLAAFGAPPMIVSISKKEFVSGGPADQFVFRIAANNFDEESTVAVFRGDTFVRPIRVIDGSQVEVAVPENYRNADGELTVQLRTNSGGLSEPTYFKVLKPKTATVGTLRTMPAVAPPRVIAPATMGSLKVNPDIVLGNRVRDAIVAKLGADAAKSINVSAKAGVITLSGTGDRAAAEAAAVNVSGVKSVVNEIR